MTTKPVTRDWLIEHYVVRGMGIYEIGRIVNRNPKQVWNWLRGEGIETRERGHAWMSQPEFAFWLNGKPSPFAGHTHTEETKRLASERCKASGIIPYDPAVGPPFRGKRGAEIPSWKGGVTPERQAFYSSEAWKQAVKEVWKRDNATCQRCGKKNSGKERFAFDIHHIVSFACIELRATVSNLVLLCEDCHYWVHSRENTLNEFTGHA